MDGCTVSTLSGTSGVKGILNSLMSNMETTIAEQLGIEPDAEPDEQYYEEVWVDEGGW